MDVMRELIKNHEAAVARTKQIFSPLGDNFQRQIGRRSSPDFPDPDLDVDYAEKDPYSHSADDPPESSHSDKYYTGTYDYGFPGSAGSATTSTTTTPTCTGAVVDVDTTLLTQCYSLAVDTTISSDDFYRIDFTADPDGVDLWFFSAEEDDFIRAAWAVLLENIDLIDWAACFVLGPDSSQKEELLESISGDRRTLICALPGVYSGMGGFPASLALLGELVSGLLALASTVAISASLAIVLTTVAEVIAAAALYISVRYHGMLVIYAGSMWSEMLSEYNSGDLERRQCAIMELATVLLHELTHTCGLSLGDPSKTTTDNVCWESYTIENNFRWALFHRYASTTAWAGVPTCGDAGHHTDDVFGSGDIRGF